MIFKNIAPAFLLSAALLCLATAGCESVVEPENDSRVEIQNGKDGEPGKPGTGNNRGTDGTDNNRGTDGVGVDGKPGTAEPGAGNPGRTGNTRGTAEPGNGQRGADGVPGRGADGKNGESGNGADGGSANAADGKNGESSTTAAGKNGGSANGADGKPGTGGQRGADGGSANGADGKSVTATGKSGGTVRGSGKVVSVTRKLEPFRSLVVSLGDRLEIIQGDSPSLTIEAEETAVSLLESSTEDGTLHLRWKSGTNTVIGDGKTATMIINGKKIVVPAVFDLGAKDGALLSVKGSISSKGGVSFSTGAAAKGTRTIIQGLQVPESGDLTISGKNLTINGVIIDTSRPVKLFVLQKPVVLRLTVPDIDQMTISGKTLVTCKSLRTQSLNLRVVESSRVSIGQLTADDVSIRASGSGSVSLAGTARQQTIRISGSAMVGASRLSGNSANVRASGRGNATVAVTSSLDVRISGSAKVSYSGSPDITKRISGSGKLVKGN